jgi:hypothetical protein
MFANYSRGYRVVPPGSAFIDFCLANCRIPGILTAEEHLKMLANVVARLNALHEELKALEDRVATQRALVAEDIDFIQRQRDRLNSRKP